MISKKSLVSLEDLKAIIDKQQDMIETQGALIQEMGGGLGGASGVCKQR